MMNKKTLILVGTLLVFLWSSTALAAQSNLVQDTGGIEVNREVVTEIVHEDANWPITRIESYQDIDPETKEVTFHTTVIRENERWQKYYDSDYGFIVDFPTVDWEVQTMWHAPESEQQAITKRVSFLGSQTEIMVDIWKQPQEDIVAWVEYLTQYVQPDLEVATNGEIAGFPAVVFLDENVQAPDVLMTTFSDENHTYLVRYLLSDGGQAMEAYLRLLETFQSAASSDAEVAGTFYFPMEIQEKAIQSASFMMVGNCCGVSDPGNPFPCDNGNCTWWVYYRKSYVPMTGDASQWGWDVYQGLYPGWYLSGDPAAGAIAWWDQGTCWSASGHVAHVDTKSGYDTWIKVSEMTWQGTACNQEPRYRTINIPSCQEPTGYIRQ